MTGIQQHDRAQATTYLVSRSAQSALTLDIDRDLYEKGHTLELGRQLASQDFGVREEISSTALRVKFRPPVGSSASLHEVQLSLQ